MRTLCLGNNTEQTDLRTRELAHGHGQICHGLLSELHGPFDSGCFETEGFYHTSIYDIEFGRLLELANHFDSVCMLDQPLHEWSHPNAFFLTVKVIKQLGAKGVFLDDSYQTHIDYFSNLVERNKSFCIFPFIELLVNDQHTTVCCRSSQPISPIQDLDFATDPNYTAIRSRMLQGDLLPEHCSHCYNIERQGLPSARMQETVEWANRLGLRHERDLEKITQPVYYEVRASNKCNLQCRMCGPASSHLIAEEYQRIGIMPQTSAVTKHTTGFEIIRHDDLKKLYVAGGEPMIMPQLYDFMDRCIRHASTDFEFIINTNGTKLSQKFRGLAREFSNLQFIFSIDGYSDINYYIRWPSDWDDIIANWQYLVDAGHKVTVNTTVSIYNISNLHLLYEFIDRRFPKTLVHCQIVQEPAYLSPWLFPDRDLARHSLARVLRTRCCQNDLLFRDSILGYITVLENLGPPDPSQLGEFFQFNDLLDSSRQIRLIDYVPALESNRNRCIDSRNVL